MRRALAICWRISADGLRSPRSIWLRYGLEMPAMSDSLRRERRATLRCSRMNSPRSRIRDWMSSMATVKGYARCLRAEGDYGVTTSQLLYDAPRYDGVLIGTRRSQSGAKTLAMSGSNCVPPIRE